MRRCGASRGGRRFVAPEWTTGLTPGLFRLAPFALCDLHRRGARDSLDTHDSPRGESTLDFAYGVARYQWTDAVRDPPVHHESCQAAWGKPSNSTWKFASFSGGSPTISHSPKILDRPDEWILILHVHLPTAPEWVH